MDPYEDTNDPKNPPTSFRRLRVHSDALPWFIGALAAVVVLIAVVLLFWTAAHPQSVAVEQNDNEERIVGTSGYSTEGGHDPIRPFGSTRNELKFRGDTMQPIPMPPSATQRR